MSNYKIIVYLDNSKFWFEKDLYFHDQESDCSIEYHFNGSKYWYQKGKPHREDGPAFEESNGSKEWFLNGIKFSEKEFEKHSQINKKQELISCCNNKIIEIEGKKYKLVEAN